MAAPDETSPPALRSLAERYGIRLLLRFGSTATGRTHSRSDQDLGVLFHGPVPATGELAELASALQELYPGGDVDLAVMNRADPLFLKKLLETATLLYGSRRELANLRIYAFRRHVDHRRFLRMEREFVRRELASRGCLHD